MNAITPIQRREFLTTTTRALAAAAALEGLGAWRGFGAQTASPAPKTPQALNDLLAELEAKGRQFLSVPRQDGQFLNLLVKVARAKNVLEVGTSHGYSAIWIALALQETDGRLTTIEIQPDRVKLAQDHLAQAGLAQRVTFLQGDAHQIVPTLDGPFDFVFLDADKEGQMDYFQKLFPNKLTRGAVLTVHNAIRAREPMRDYLEMIARHPEFDSVILSLTMEDGFSVSYRHRV
jgi:predicted O-methyltransferase YrrM